MISIRDRVAGRSTVRDPANLRHSLDKCSGRKIRKLARICGRHPWRPREPSVAAPGDAKRVTGSPRSVFPTLGSAYPGSTNGTGDAEGGHRYLSGRLPRG